ncbi:hypothetical protein KV557_25650 [Kitasatospora aureofaciens]|uniref:hypothetical protein n=1 Tax=Kitasatospora aureofaciens TaxID=1894 RepID=UPI001C43BC7A|nr:hypothetical protein [Kitasatospora aureofaciens]MBV6700445.1 hypothetical protein [Kitasatospora aureofaciens]
MTRTQTLALRLSLALAAAFTVFAYATSQAHLLRAASPWQSDPYDAVVSFTLFLVPALAALTAVRALLCRRGVPQPGYRVDQLLRAARLSTVLVAATVSTDWTAAALCADRELWDERTPWLIAALLPLSVGAAACLTLLRRAFRQPAPTDTRRTGGDWLDDLALLAAPLVDLRAATAFLRRHIAGAAAALSVLAGGLLATGQAVGEGWPGPGIAFLELSVNTGGFFAFCLISNALLRIAATGDRPGDRPGAARTAAVAAALALPVTGGLRDALWAMAGLPGAVDSPGKLLALIYPCALLAGAITWGVVRLWGRTR